MTQAPDGFEKNIPGVHDPPPEELMGRISEYIVYHKLINLIKICPSIPLASNRFISYGLINWMPFFYDGILICKLLDMGAIDELNYGKC
jgi:hypothetical protein